MVKRKHDRRYSSHFPLSIQYRGKADSAYVERSCGYVELIAVWDKQTELGGFQSGREINAVEAFLECITNNHLYTGHK